MPGHACVPAELPERRRFDSCLREFRRHALIRFRPSRAKGSEAMKAALLYQYDGDYTGPEFLRIENVADPVIEDPTDVIVRIGGAGLCRTDLHIIEGIWRSKVAVQLPYIPGHENAGWVQEVGSS